MQVKITKHSSLIVIRHAQDFKKYVPQADSLATSS